MLLILTPFGMSMLTDATNKYRVKKPSIDILWVYFYATILMLHCELYMIKATNSIIQVLLFFKFGKRTHNKISIYKFYSSISWSLCSDKAKE